MKKQSRACWLAFAGLTVALSGCLGPMRLPDGRQSGLSATGAATRSHLAPVPVSGILPTYQPAHCLYDERKRDSLGAATHKRVTFTVERKQPGDRLFVNMSGLRGEGTILMDKTGRLIDTDVLARDNTHQLTSEDFDRYADEQLKNFHSILATDPHVLNDTTAIFPHFIAFPSRPGVRVADVLMEHQRVWGFYLYEGMVTYQGRRADLLDLIHIERRGPVVRGFLLFDTQHALPLLLNLSLGYTSYELEQVECTAR